MSNTTREERLQPFESSAKPVKPRCGYCGETSALYNNSRVMEFGTEHVVMCVSCNYITTIRPGAQA